MLFLLTAALAVLRAQAAPLSAGPATVPTIIHTLVFRIRPRTDCSGADLRNLGDVVWSCLITTGACVYQAIHPDVPKVGCNRLMKWGDRLTRTMWALAMPELVIFLAIKQRFGAKIAAMRFNELVLGLGWEETQGHFAQMGGFASKDDNQILSSSTLIQLLEDGRLDVEELRSVTKEDIEDKSKGDWLSKGLVALQTTWFVCECLARLQQKLPLLELEVVTLAFATLNVLTYALWWHKPLNVNRPIFLHVRPLPNTTTPSDLPSASSGAPFEPGPDQIPSSNPSQDGGSPEVEHSTSKEAGQSRPKGARGIVQGFVDYFQAGDGMAFSVFPMPFEGEALVEVGLLIALIFASVHFLSWFSTFPTRAELILWRIACLLMAEAPALGLLSSCSLRISQALSSGTRIQRTVMRFHEICNIFAVYSLRPYIFARLFIGILALIALRRLPPGAMTNVSWTSYIPHL
ncbi:hypothetical protein BDN72DRAFT_964656 [Pluteus cervinus]|uniref:Uncharacterized protein n=1 Tax=Pluteus cervinus TaxID=181527 RepID=A0ACD3AAB1_9AGAR|nr:hypothetical protein BDN72DRAFT_964656 [Pluteus cervinus]